MVDSILIAVMVICLLLVIPADAKNDFETAKGMKKDAKKWGKRFSHGVKSDLDIAAKNAAKKVVKPAYRTPKKKSNWTIW